MALNGSCTALYAKLFYTLQEELLCILWLIFNLHFLGRRVLIFPKGNNVDHLSMYLDVADSATLPYGWSRYAQFSLSVVNQIHNKYSIRKGNLLLTVSILLVMCQSFM